MVFNSYTFIIFLGIVFALYFSPISWRAKKLVLLLASYLFYAAWNAPFVALIWFSTIVDWELAQRIYYATSVKRRKAYLTLSLAVNLGLLGFFKYSNFMLDSFQTLLGNFGMSYQAPLLDIILPVGISFYTFQTLSYSIDVYRKKLKPWHSFLDYALYVTFFPQLVAGPIVRAIDFLPQTVQLRLPTRNQFGWGLSLLVLGLFQKVVIADGFLAPIVERVYDSGGIVTQGAAYIGTLAFAGQIFCDFAGYSTIAIGVAMCLGFALPDNFRFPYAAIGFSDFWRRWHISLSTWLRDYLYISLGGSRHGSWKTYRNLALTMLLGGLWHGASWTFVVWGGLHGTYLVIERLARKQVGHWLFWQHWIAQLWLGLTTFFFVCLAWVFFRADSFGKAVSILKSALMPITETGTAVSDRDMIIVAGLVGALAALHWVMRNTTLEDAARKVPVVLRAMLLGTMLFLIVNSPGDDRAFIYFQF